MTSRQQLIVGWVLVSPVLLILICFTVLAFYMMGLKVSIWFVGTIIAGACAVKGSGMLDEGYTRRSSEKRKSK